MKEKKEMQGINNNRVIIFKQSLNPVAEEADSTDS